MVGFFFVRAFFWIDYRIIEFIGHLSFCKNRGFYDGDSETKWGMLFLGFFVGAQEKRNIYKKEKKKKKKRKKKRGVIGI